MARSLSAHARVRAMRLKAVEAVKNYVTTKRGVVLVPLAVVSKAKELDGYAMMDPDVAPHGDGAVDEYGAVKVFGGSATQKGASTCSYFLASQHILLLAFFFEPNFSHSYTLSGPTISAIRRGYLGLLFRPCIVGRMKIILHSGI